MLFFAWILFLDGVLCYPTTGSGKQIIDLTHEFANGYTIAWPSALQYNFTIGWRGFNEDSGFYYEANNFQQAEHCGTHMDAPSHFAKGKWRAADIPVERLIGPGVVIDISERARSNKDAQLTIEDLQNWETRYGTIPQGAIVIMYSDHGRFYGNKTAYFGWPPGTEENNPTDTKNLHFPGFSKEAAEWLISNRTIFGTGVDTASVDYGQSQDFISHQIFSAKNIWGLENLNNVDKLPPNGFTIYNMVYKSKEGSGGPTRVIAILDSDSNSAKIPTSMQIIYLLMIQRFLFTF